MQNFADGQSVQPVHHHIQHDEVGTVAPDLEQGFQAVARGDHFVVTQSEVEPDEFNHVGLIIHDQNLRSHVSTFVFAPGAGNDKAVKVT